MATHSSVLAWRIPGTGEPGGLPSMASQSQTQLKRLSSSSSSWKVHTCFIKSILFSGAHVYLVFLCNIVNFAHHLLQQLCHTYLYFPYGWRRLLRVPWTARRSNQSILKEIEPWDFFGGNDAEAETPVLWPPHAKSWLIGKDPDAGRDWGQEEKGMTEDKMAGWHHWLDGCESEWTPEVGDGQGGLACCNSWSRKESDTTEQLNWTELKNVWIGIFSPGDDFSFRLLHYPVPVWINSSSILL